MAATMESHPLFINPLLSSKTPLQIHTQVLNFSNFRIKTPPLLSSSTTTKTITHCVAAPPPSADSDPELDPVSIASEKKTGDRRKIVRVAWEKLVRWSRSWRSKAKTDVLERTNKVSVSSLYIYICMCVHICICTY